MPSGSFHGNLGGTSFCHPLWCAASLSPCGRLWYMPADASLHLLNKPLAKTWKSKGRFGPEKHATFEWKVAELRCVNDRLMIWNLYAWFWLQSFFLNLFSWMFLSIIVLSPYDFCDWWRQALSLSVCYPQISHYIARSFINFVHSSFQPVFYFYWRKALSAN